MPIPIGGDTVTHPEDTVKFEPDLVLMQCFMESNMSRIESEAGGHC